MPRPGASLDEASEALMAEIDRLLRDGVTDQEVARAKKALVASAVYARDSLSAAPNIIGRALATGRTIDEFESWPDRIKVVTVAEVNAAARAVLVPEHSVIGLLKPKPRPVQKAAREN